MTELIEPPSEEFLKQLRAECRNWKRPSDEECLATLWRLRMDRGCRWFGKPLPPVPELPEGDLRAIREKAPAAWIVAKAHLHGKAAGILKQWNQEKLGKVVPFFKKTPKGKK